jgi:hypothetical protein
MRFRSLALSIVFAALLAGSITAVKAQDAFVTIPLPHDSVPNQVIDFYAGGSSDGYTLRISPQGGTLSIGDYIKMALTPWGYVTALWPTGREYIIFLVNVTETDFRIGFLYLSNSTNQAFLLRMFDYSTQNVNIWNFQGAQHVYNNTVTTARVQLPSLHLPTPATVTNDISALGPQIYLTTKGGLLLNGTTSFNIYPLMNQLYTGATDYNEVWSLLADEGGNYYFAILYMQNSDPSHVIIEHRLRLNDYRRLNGQTIQARWQKGSFVNHATIRMPMPNLTVNVDSFPFQTNNNGVVSVGIPNGIVTVGVPDAISNSTNANLQFAGWSKFGSSNPLRIRVNSTLDITAKYQSEYPLAVTSLYGNPQGAGWYPAGSNATFSVENEIDYSNGTRRIFEQWEGDSTAADHSSWVLLNSAKNVVAVWKTQYNVTIQTVGLPTDSSAVILVENSPVTINGTSAYSTWVDANKQLTISVASTQIQDPNGNYSLQEIHVNNQTNNGIIDVAKPLVVSLVFSETPRQTTGLSLQVVPSIAVTGVPLYITGSIGDPTSGSGSVVISYSSGDSGWLKIANVPISQNGKFAYTWQATAAGDYKIKASWPGDSEYSPNAQVVGVRVIGSGQLGAGTDVFTKVFHDSFAAARSIPYVSFFFMFTTALMTLGSVSASFMIPGGSPIMGNFIGSLFVGFALVFPLFAVAVLVRAARTKRKPSLLWVTPLLALWLSSLALVFLSPVFALGQPIVASSQLLLTLSNVFTFPMLAAFRLARLVV